MEFPHLDDTKFPHLDNVNVYAYHNDFDYSRWIPQTKIHLVNVLWDNTYADCVKFDNDAKRDEYFSSITDDNATYTLTSNALVVDNQVKVPIPYDVVCQYNYLYVEIPPFTQDKLIDYENTDGVKRWYFFINDFKMKAPNTTVLNLSLDYWTQYINSVQISYMQLERGHAPVAAVDTDSYLANPIEQCNYLLTPDVNFGSETVCRDKANYIPFGNGEKYLCIASVCAPWQLEYLGEMSSQDGWSGASFTDAEFNPYTREKYGRAYNVDGYNWSDGKDYANLNTPAGNDYTENGILMNNVCVYAINTLEGSQFINDVVAKQPQFMQTIKACFVVDEKMLKLKYSVTIAGHTLRVCYGDEYIAANIKLDKDSFNIPKKYQKFAKLYTSPYSELEITDNNGHAVKVKVENMSNNVEVKAITAIAYPYLNARMFVRGIDGYGSQTYVWVHLQDIAHLQDYSISNSDWKKYCFDFDIPCFELYMDGNTAHYISNYNREIRAGRAGALTAYHNNVRSTNVGYHTICETNNTVYSNLVNNDNPAMLANAQLAKDAGINSANVQADAMTTTARNTSNVNRTINTNNILLNDAIKNEDQTYKANYTRDCSDYYINQDCECANELTDATTTAENENIASQADNNAYAAAISGTTNTVNNVVGSIESANVLSAISGGITGAIDTAAQTDTIQHNAGSSINCNNSVAEAQKNYTTKKTQLALMQNGSILENYWGHYDVTFGLNTATANKNNDLIYNGSTGLTNTNANVNANATRAAAEITNNAAYDAAYNLYAPYDIGSKAKSGYASRETGNINAEKTEFSSLFNAQDTLEQTRFNAMCAQTDAKNYAPVSYGVQRGDATMDYHKNKGIQVKYKTQDLNAITAAGDYFARYGYALNHNWQYTKWCLMKYFTYWKVSEIWLYSDDKTNNSAQTILSEILKAGVTIWSDPDRIGKVSIYDNY